MNRRNFLVRAALGGASLGPIASLEQAPAEDARISANVRGEWIRHLTQVAEPVLTALATHQLKARMPVEAKTARSTDRKAVSHLEALGRVLAGNAPWLGTTGSDAAEEKHRARLSDLARKALANAVSETSADRINFTAGGQNLVDAAFLALGLARARTELWDRLDQQTRHALVAALQSTRKFKPGQNNWLLFSAMIEAFLASVGAAWKLEPIDAAMKAHEAWYKGDGVYGDGPDFHWDYYNSFVIQPFLIVVLELIDPIDGRWKRLKEPVAKRALRYAAVQERLIASDGSFPPLGRSLAYRCGAFHHLAMMAHRRQLPAGVSPAQVREALTAVIRRTLAVPGTFDKDGWLRIGLAGHQPALGESYISTGSLYLCTLAFLPLGLPAGDDFWSAPSAEWTSKKVWSGTDIPADHALGKA